MTEKLTVDGVLKENELQKYNGRVRSVAYTLENGYKAYTELTEKLGVMEDMLSKLERSEDGLEGMDDVAFAKLLADANKAFNIAWQSVRITADQIACGSITATQIAANTITAGKVKIGNW